MHFTIEVQNLGQLQDTFEEHLLVTFFLDKAYSDKKEGFTDLETQIKIIGNTTDGETFVVYDGTLGDYITPASFQLNIGKNEATFTDRDELDNFIRKLVNEKDYSIKTSISIIDEGKTGNFINQFIGEIWHYLNDWDEMMLGKKA